MQKIVNSYIKNIIVRQRIYFILFAIQAFTYPVLFSQYSEHLYDVEDGLTHNTVLDITSDQNGFIWVFTAHGTCRFDGNRFKEYKVLLNNFESRINYNGRFLRDKQDRIWIESTKPALLFYNNMKDRIDVKYQIPYTDFYDIIDNGVGDIYFSGTTKIIHIRERNEQFLVSEIKIPEEAGQINYMEELKDGTVLASSQFGLFRISFSGDSMLCKKISVINPANSKEYYLGSWTNLISGNQSLLLLNEGQILRTSIQIDKPVVDSVIFAEPIKLTPPSSVFGDQQYVFAAVRGEKDDIVIRTGSGIYRYNLQDESIELIKYENNGKIDLSEGNYLEALYYDPNGILWAGTDRGLLKIILEKKNFHTLLPEPDNPVGLKTGNLSSVLVDRKDGLWIGSMGSGLFYSAKDKNGNYSSFINYLPDDENPRSIHSSAVSALFEDSRNRLWVGAGDLQWMNLNNSKSEFNYTEASTYKQQLGLGLNPVNILEEEAGYIISLSWANPSYIIDPGGKKAYALALDSMKRDLSWPTIYKMADGRSFLFNNCRLYEYSDWILNNDGTDLFPGDSGWLEHFKDRTLIPWAYPSGLDTLLYFDSLHIIMTNFILSEKTAESELWLPIELVSKLYHTSLEQLEKVHNNQSTRGPEFSLFPPGEDFKPETIYDIIEDHKGQIWGTTMNGLMRIDPARESINWYYKDDGLSTDKFHIGHFIDSDGRIFACTSNGLLYFDPDSIISDPPPDIYISSIRLNYKAVEVDKFSFMKISPFMTNKLELKYNQNFLGFEFSAFNYRNSSRIVYKFMLEGADKDWVTSDARRIADYPDLKPGRYVFRVIAANGNGVWNMKGTRIDIKINPPFWFSWWALLCEGLLIIVLLIFFIRYREHNHRKRALLLEQKVEETKEQILEQRKEMDTMKNRFYVNISHEFRTPLTLLVGPLEESIKEKNDSVTFSKRMANTMLRNARSLQRLINQLLDISKLDSGKMELQLTRGNLSDFIKAIASAFISLADSKQIEFIMEIEEGNEDSCFDPDKIEKVVTNLLSNAFKFTESGGKVLLALIYKSSEDDNEVFAHLKVSDTGKGMDKDQVGKIFDIFYQVSDVDTREFEGSGIGLSLAKELVELMEGSISVESQPDKGSTFSVSFPVSELSFPDAEILDNSTTDRDFSLIPEQYSDESTEELKTEELSGAEVILVVEDNADLRKYIGDKFRGSYRVEEAENGVSGFEKACRIIPDLVITDLMMPVMGGLELCRKLKSHPLTNHIPVIMLTAKAGKENKIEGLEAEADDYLVKPFDSEELLVRVRNLIKQRKELQKRFEKNFFVTGSELKHESSQHQLIKEIISRFEKHLDDPDYSLDSLADELNMSRSNLFRKVGAITGSTPNELLRMTRIRKAAQLLRSKNVNVTQAMYQVGLKNMSHFASSFKKYIGQNPGDYLRGDKAEP